MADAPEVKPPRPRSPATGEWGVWPPELRGASGQTAPVVVFSWFSLETSLIRKTATILPAGISLAAPEITGVGNLLVKTQGHGKAMQGVRLGSGVIFLFF